MRKWIPLLLVLSFLAGCSNVQIGREFDLQTFASRVEYGKTTQEQVRGWLGAPVSTGTVVDTGGERFEEWTYYQGGGRLPNMPDAHLKILQIKFDRQGIVKGYNWSGDKAKK